MTGTIVPIGVGTATRYPRESRAGAGIDTLIEPGNTNPPILFEPPPALSGGALEVWLIASGGPDWGGCQIWVSSDGNTYALAGTLHRGARQGVLTANLPNHADPDSTDTLSIDLTQSQGQLLSATTADADNFVTLSYCGGELVSYRTATLTAAYKYDLTYLRRGAYGTPIASHAAGSGFARFGPNDPSLFRYRYPKSFIGQTIQVKLPAFNIFGQQLQGLAGLTAATYTLTGTGQPPLGVPFTYLGMPQAASLIVRHTFIESGTLPAGFVGSRATAGVAASTTAVFDIALNGGNVATMTFAATATANFAGATTVTFVPGDVLTVTPRSSDPQLADISGFLATT